MSDEQPTYHLSDADANDGVGLAEAISAVERVIEALAPFDISTSHIEQTLLQLRSWQDPWHEAKQAIKVHLDNGGHRVKAVAQYAQYLEKELANRKPLWVVVHVDADNGLDYQSNGAINQYVFVQKKVAEYCRQQATNPSEYRVQEVWGKK
jgi:hypothetical protein